MTKLIKRSQSQTVLNRHTPPKGWQLLAPLGGWWTAGKPHHLLLSIAYSLSLQISEMYQKENGPKLYLLPNRKEKSVKVVTFEIHFARACRCLMTMK